MPALVLIFEKSARMESSVSESVFYLNFYKLSHSSCLVICPYLPTVLLSVFYHFGLTPLCFQKHTQCLVYNMVLYLLHLNAWAFKVE